MIKQAMDQEKVRGYLNRAFGDDLGEVEAALEELAAAYGSDEIGNNAYRLYENFRCRRRVCLIVRAYSVHRTRVRPEKLELLE